ncbi:MAG: hypothetical protein A2571_03440 [Candidatus Vogelbacteria bacterium RIFOXYD1_FULL_44_32]|uniref:Bacterial spore germination immunoglobulin-like domain-containing protein n=1 Tax=Candidatus Vogelbacteria bacterium RIFOXYD1_FULL_44_32 TaxID=1802438 RepID=A0A1G2QE90_9BACT|nr:MAG: hypothetical protein A2571_03440 [Candidatus Vogelbacteria bacterium RIFOXYD1_FULL_44_32]
MKKQNILLLIVVLAVAGSSWWLINEVTPTPVQISEINSFEDCVDAGYPILESYPEQCQTADGRSFTRDIGNANELTNLIVLDSPRPGERVTSPLTITGQARGTWYFEASFPVEIQDESGKTLAQVPAQAQGEWMTEEFVPFAVTIDFAAPISGTGKLILHKDNPSGLPENDNSLIVPLKFTPATTTPITSGCVVGGCSSQLCVEKSAGTDASTCEWSPKYACYQAATCARNTAGQCAWVETPTLKACLAKNTD